MYIPIKECRLRCHNDSVSFEAMFINLERDVRVLTALVEGVKSSAGYNVGGADVQINAL